MQNKETKNEEARSGIIDGGGSICSLKSFWMWKKIQVECSARLVVREKKKYVLWSGHHRKISQKKVGIATLLVKFTAEEHQMGYYICLWSCR